MAIVNVSSSALTEACVGRTWTASQIFVLFQRKQMFWLCSYMHVHSLMHCGSIASGEFARSSAHRLSGRNRRGEIFSLECLLSSKVQGLVPRFHINLYGKSLFYSFVRTKWIHAAPLDKAFGVV